MTPKFRVFNTVKNEYPKIQEQFFITPNGEIHRITAEKSCYFERCEDHYVIELLVLDNPDICKTPIYHKDAVRVKLPDDPYEKGRTFEGVIEFDEYDGRFFIDEYGDGTYGWDAHYLHGDMKIEVIGHIHSGTTVNSVNKPQFTHDCKSCIFLGKYSCEFGHKEYDLFVCRNEISGFCYIARYGNEGEDYMACSYDSYTEGHPLYEARKRYKTMLDGENK